MSCHCWSNVLNSLLLFLNELSCQCTDPALLNTTLTQVLHTLRCIKELKTIRPDFLLVSHQPIQNLPMGDGTQTLGAFLWGVALRDEWRVINSLAQTSPWDSYPDAMQPGQLEEIRYSGVQARGMTWARKNNSIVLSFGYPPDWSQDHISAHFDDLDPSGNYRSMPVVIRNLSRSDHLQSHSRTIQEYGHEISPSTLIYESGTFTARMYPYDHNPPHMHVFSKTYTKGYAAKVAIKTLDIIAGQLPTALEADVKEWTAANREALVMNWERCRVGHRTFALAQDRN